jgi:hypothetical protein
MATCYDALRNSAKRPTALGHVVSRPDLPCAFVGSRVAGGNSPRQRVIWRVPAPPVGRHNRFCAGGACDHDRRRFVPREMAYEKDRPLGDEIVSA